MNKVNKKRSRKHEDLISFDCIESKRKAPEPTDSYEESKHELLTEKYAPRDLVHFTNNHRITY